jgi:hypothetical protein
MLRRTLIAMLAAGFLMTTAQAQQPPAATQKPQKPAGQPPPAQPPPPTGEPVNIKIDLTITDQAAPGEAVKRNVSMLVADGRNGSIRSGGRVVSKSGAFTVNLNVDATPRILKGGVIRLDLGIEYVPKPGSENAETGEGRAQLNERLSLMVQSGKPTIISQASDPTSDRKIVVELTATILP